ncbi:hypothetical protein JTE90_011316 [Oedothorax gibbosus]|uniref:Uncharacterized protein n=1 Tax=Oedothorax gibbosus TaxID=931172 RepID=A0AAV6VKZ3_9ARAC|nr:hypothetical protein JTE90_011316 [Oedothorax gibbosus]
MTGFTGPRRMDWKAWLGPHLVSCIGGRRGRFWNTWAFLLPFVIPLCQSAPYCDRNLIGLQREISATGLEAWTSIGMNGGNEFRDKKN